jgi:hypothetical protein
MTAGCGISQAKDEAMLQDLSARFIEAVRAAMKTRSKNLQARNTRTHSKMRARPAS